MALLAKHPIFEGVDGNTLALARGDQDGFQTLFERYYEPLCAYSAGFVEAGDIAEEIVQSVFVQLWYRCERSDVTGNVKAYLYTAVRNRARNVKRHDRVIQRLHGSVADALASGCPIPGIVGVTVETDAELEQGEAAAQIQTLIRSLPARMREVLTLRWDHGMSYREIASVLGIREKSAKQQHSRAIAALRQLAVGAGGDVR